MIGSLWFAGNDRLRLEDGLWLHPFLPIEVDMRLDRHQFEGFLVLVVDKEPVVSLPEIGGSLCLVGEAILSLDLLATESLRFSASVGVGWLIRNSGVLFETVHRLRNLLSLQIGSLADVLDATQDPIVVLVALKAALCPHYFRAVPEIAELVLLLL